jgi:hypothetical protein
VPHRGGSYVYPISAGESYVTEYAVVTVETAPEEGEEIEAGEYDPEAEAIEEKEEEAEGFKYNDPLNPEEQEDALFLSSSKHRDKNKPVKKREGRHILRQKPLPKGNPLYARPSYPKEEPGEIYNLNVGMCSEFNCPIWEVAINEGTFKVLEDRAEYWTADRCNSNIDTWWEWNLEIDLETTGNRRQQVKRGSGQHITYYCKFHVSIFPLAEIGLMTNYYSLQEWVFPNGYTERHAIRLHPPYYEN